MRIYLIRHATAEDSAKSGGDDARELTNEGVAEGKVIGSAFDRLGVAPRIYLTSPLVRAVRTAELAAKLNKGQIEIVEFLRNGTSFSDLCAGLKPWNSKEEIALVGHAPSLPEHLSEFLGSPNTNGLAMGKGTVACIETDRLRAGAARLVWFLRQKQLRLIASSKRD